MTPSQVKQYYVFFSLFVFTMLVVALSNNIIMMWVAIEATTLSTVFLVGAYSTKLSLEAAWKYVIVCTAGVAFGLYGTVLVYANAADVMADAHQAVFWTSLLPYASQFDVVLMQIAFVFAAIGFGTKAGLFPMHTWLPDAHSEAPSPVSGLLSGVLLKCAMLIIIRFYILAVQAIGPDFPQTLMLVLGILSWRSPRSPCSRRTTSSASWLPQLVRERGRRGPVPGLRRPSAAWRRRSCTASSTASRGAAVLPVGQRVDEVRHPRPQQDQRHPEGGPGHGRAAGRRPVRAVGLPAVRHVLSEVMAFVAASWARSCSWWCSPSR